MTVSPGRSMRTLQSQGRERSYILYVPAAHDGTTPLSVVFDFHGGMFGADSAESGSGFRMLADRENFIYVAPQGIDNVWDARTDSDELFVRDVLAELDASTCLDRKRIYATGCSNGAALSFWLACHASDVFAAIAPLCGTSFFDLASECKPERPVPVMLVIGENDPLNCWDGGTLPLFEGVDVPCAKTVQRDLGQLYHCTGAVESTHEGACETVAQCDADAEVTICKAQTPEGGILQTHVVYKALNLDVTEATWAFISRYHLP